MARRQEPRSPRAMRSPPASPAKPAALCDEPDGAQDGQAEFARDVAPGGSRPPRPKRVNSYSELNFSSIVRVDSLGTMALPAFGEGGSRRGRAFEAAVPARAPSFGIDVDEEEETGEAEQRAE